MRLLLAAATALCVSASSASAQWSQVGGDYQVAFDYRTSGGFGCLQQHYAVELCESDGTTMKVWNGNAFAAFSFTGLSGRMTAANYTNGPIHFGTMHVRIGGAGPFTWPTMVARSIPSFGMNVQLQTLNTPNPSLSSKWFGFIWASPTGMQAFLGEGNSNNLRIPLPYPQPSYLNYGVVMVENFNMPHIDKATDGDYDLYAASVSLIPEPGTYALMALGLAAVGLAARRRKR